MKNSVVFLNLVAMMTFTVSAQQIDNSDQVKPGMKPGDLFYWVENVVES